MWNSCNSSELNNTRTHPYLADWVIELHTEFTMWLGDWSSGDGTDWDSFREIWFGGRRFEWSMQQWLLEIDGRWCMMGHLFRVQIRFTTYAIFYTISRQIFTIPKVWALNSFSLEANRKSWNRISIGYVALVGLNWEICKWNFDIPGPKFPYSTSWLLWRRYSKRFRIKFEKGCGSVP